MRAFLGLDILVGGQKISILKRRSKNLDTPKKTSRYQLKESPVLFFCMYVMFSAPMVFRPPNGKAGILGWRYFSPLSDRRGTFLTDRRCRQQGLSKLESLLEALSAQGMEPWDLVVTCDVGPRLGIRKSMQTFSGQSSARTLRLWASAPKTCAFLRPRWLGGPV